jgi:serine/threonine protein kinase
MLHSLYKNVSAQVKDVANGLKYLHSQEVIHADLHCVCFPQEHFILIINFIMCQRNILVDDEEHVRLSDFGRAKVIGEAGYSTALMVGSAEYMAPELFPSSEPDVNVDKLFSKQSDVYAFAMVCFEVRHAVLLTTHSLDSYTFLDVYERSTFR